MHKNSNESVGNFGVYEILVFDITFKIGKADLDRITLSTNTPTRIHQQVQKLVRMYGQNNVMYRILHKLFGVITKEAKELERIILQLIYEKRKSIPEGNTKSYNPVKRK